MSTVNELLRRRALPHLIEEARAAVRHSGAMLDRFDKLATHAPQTLERIENAKLVPDWERQLEEDRATLAALKAEQAKIERGESQ